MCVRVESAHWVLLQIALQTALSPGIVASHEELLGGNIGQGILFAHLQVDVATQGVHIVSVCVHVVLLHIDRFQVLQSHLRFIASRIAADHGLVSLCGPIHLTLVEIDQT